jgi:hypothetical protein
MKKIILLSIALTLSILLWSTTFTEIATNLPGLWVGNSEWGDYDADGDYDVLLTGIYTDYPQTKIYRNDNGVFYDSGIYLRGLWHSRATWVDYDNDNDLDIYMCGSDSTNNNVSYLYQNNYGSFIYVDSILDGINGSTYQWSDFNNDGTLDFFISGWLNDECICKLFYNIGNSFVDSGFIYQALDSASSDIGDYDNDGDLDIIYTGREPNGTIQTYTTHILRNDNNTFTSIQTAIVGVGNIATVNWGDYDNDGDLDILLSGYDGINAYSRIYRNDNSQFINIGAGIVPVFYSSSAWGDYDNDGDLDFVLSGRIPSNSYTLSRIYRNDNGAFTNMGIPDKGVQLGSSTWCDYDNDNDLDMLLSGHNGDNGIPPNTLISVLYANEDTPQNTLPTTPNNLRTSVIGDYVIFEWDASTDAQTPLIGLNYSLRIGTFPGGNDILSSLSNSNGHRLIQSKGYANSACFWKIKLSSFNPFQTYYWGVQAVDGCYAGSAFSESELYLGSKLVLIPEHIVNFGIVPIGGQSISYNLCFQNTGTALLSIDSLAFRLSNSPFELDGTTFPFTIEPGDSASVYLIFSPLTIGTLTDTLYIYNNSNNLPLAKIKLTGICDYVPPSSPGNFNIVMTGSSHRSALISWDEVTTDIFDNPLTPDVYLIFGSDDPYDDNFGFISSSTGLSFLHYNVAAYESKMFYQIVAYKDYGRGLLERINELRRNGQPIRYKDLGID